MPFRTFAEFSLQSSTVPQPLVGSWISAGIGAASAVPFNVTLGTQTVSPNVDATAVFKAGEHALLVDPNGTHVEDVMVSAILSADRITIGLQNQTNVATQFAHASGVFGTGCFILPHILFNNLYVQPEDGNAGPLYIGNAYNMTATFRRIVKLFFVGTGAQPVDFGSTMSLYGNPYDLSELWALGTSGDKYTVSLPVL